MKDVKQYFSASYNKLCGVVNKETLLVIGLKARKSSALLISKLRLDRAFRLYALLALVVLLVSVPALWFYGLLQPVGTGESILIVVPQGSTAGSIGHQLESEGLIKSADVFNYYIRFQGLGARLKAGTYDFSPSMSVKSITDKLVSGDVVNINIRVTIPEGLTLAGVGKVFEQRGLFTQEAFLTAAKEIQLPYEYLKAMPSTVHNAIEGYLFPDTYEFPVDVKPEQVIRVMAARFNSLILPRYEQSTIKEKYTLHQVVTMASIVEKEAVKQAERARIAGVFYNRLRIPMRLESCATIQYLLGTPRALLLVDLEIESPYNSYRNDGLPPGPIAGAGLASFEAAINPESHKLLFFVAKSDGSHIFSETYEQHLQAIKLARR